jgi:NTP pyrophosphatase (non-canonical NTP hydrolase)
MTFDEYQTKSRVTAKYANAGNNYIYPTLGLAGEAGEVADQVKRVVRGEDDGIMTDERKQTLKKELGDVLWYLAAMATELGFSFDDVAQANLEKLYSRMDRGVLHGSGDNR